VHSSSGQPAGDARWSRSRPGGRRPSAALGYEDSAIYHRKVLDGQAMDSPIRGMSGKSVDLNRWLT
jgi:hypothetical protein